MGIRYKGSFKPFNQYTEHPDPLDEILELGSPKLCYYCVQPVLLTENLVFWSADSTVLLHPKCAREFGDHLIKDGLLAEKDAKELRRARWEGKTK